MAKNIRQFIDPPDLLQRKTGGGSGGGGSIEESALMAAQAVISEQATGNGGEIGAEFLNMLRLTSNKF